MGVKKVWNALLIGLLALQVLMQAVLSVAVIRTGMLPELMVIVWVAGMLLLAGVTVALMFLRGKREVGLVRRVIACILVAATVCGCGVGIKLASDVDAAVEKVTGGVITTMRNVYVFVRVDDKAQTLTDAAGYAFGFIEDYDVDHTRQAIAQIGETVGAQIETAGYIGFEDLADALFRKDVGAVIMNGASVSLLLEVEQYADFTQRIRILETMTFSALESTEQTQPPETEPPQVEKTVTNAPFVIYISGSDTRSSMLDVSRSDVNILAVINPVTKQVLLLNTPRDYFVPNPAGNGAMDKLTHCGLYGPECSMEVLGALYDLEVDYYGQINFNGFETLVDAVGGITVYSEQSFKTGDGIYISVGENTLNGKQALAFARERYSVSGGDNGRGKNQMKVVKAVIEKMTSGTTVISRYAAILESLEGMFTTSMAASDISAIVKMQLSDMASWNIQSYAVTGIGGNAKTYSAPGSSAYVMYEDEASTAYAAQLAERVIRGETLTEADMTMPK